MTAGWPCPGSSTPGQKRGSAGKSGCTPLTLCCFRDIVVDPLCSSVYPSSDLALPLGNWQSESHGQLCLLLGLEAFCFMEPDILVPVLRHIVPLTYCVTLTVTREVWLRLTDCRWGGCYVALFSLHLSLHMAIGCLCRFCLLVCLWIPLDRT